MKIIFFTLSWTAVILCGTLAFGSSLNSVENEKVSLVCQGTSLKEVVDSVSKQTGYTIHVESDLLTMPVTGRFNEVEIGSLFRRIFRGKNISLLFSEKDKNCIVRTFGEKERKYYTAGHRGVTDALIVGLQEKDLAASQEAQRKAFQEYSKNPQSVDSLTGMTLGEIKASQQHQRKEFIQYSSNDASIDTITGKTLGRLENSHDQQRREFLAYSENMKSVDPLLGKKLTKLKKFHEMQRDQFHRFSNNPDSIDPLTGLTLGQIRASQIKQRKEFEAGTENVR